MIDWMNDVKCSFTTLIPQQKIHNEIENNRGKLKIWLWFLHLKKRIMHIYSSMIEIIVIE